MQTAQKPTGPEQKKELIMTRIFHASREQVWKAFTDSETVKQWWGPRTYTTPVARMDVRVGGSYLTGMLAPEGDAYWSTGSYLTVDPPQRLVMTDSFADEDGDIVSATYYGMSADFPLKSVVTFAFDEDGDNTRMTMTYADIDTMPDEDLAGMKQGWGESFDKLDDLFAKQAGPACAI